MAIRGRAALKGSIADMILSNAEKIRSEADLAMLSHEMHALVELVIDELLRSGLIRNVRAQDYVPQYQTDHAPGEEER